jgi:hypothetical protein
VKQAKKIAAEASETHFALGYHETDTTKNETMVTVEAPPERRDFEEEEKQPIRTPKKSAKKLCPKYAQAGDDETFNTKRTTSARRK